MTNNHWIQIRICHSIRSVVRLWLSLFIIYAHAFIPADSFSQTLPPLCIYDRAEIIELDHIKYVQVGPTGPPWETKDAGTVYIDNWPMYNMRIAEKRYNPDRWEFQDYWLGGEWIPSFNRGDYIIESYGANMVYMFHMIMIRYVPKSGPFDLKDVFQFFVYSDSSGKDPNDTFEYVVLDNVPFTKGQKIRWFALHLFKPQNGIDAGMHFWVHPEGDSVYYGYNPNTALYTNNFYRFYIGSGSHGTVYFPQFDYAREPACGSLRVFFGSSQIDKKIISEWIDSAQVPNDIVLKFPFDDLEEKDYPVQVPEHEWFYERRPGDSTKTYLFPSGGSVEPSRPKRILTLDMDPASPRYRPVKIFFPLTNHIKISNLKGQSILNIIFRDHKVDDQYNLEFEVGIAVISKASGQEDSLFIRLTPDISEDLRVDADTIYQRIIPVDGQWTFVSIDLQDILKRTFERGLLLQDYEYNSAFKIAIAGDLQFTDIIFSREPLDWKLPIATNIAEKQENIVPRDYSIAIYPNSARGKVNFQLQLQRSMMVAVDIYTITGRKVKAYAPCYMQPART